MTEIEQVLQNALAAFRSGDQRAARQWAERAIALAPGTEDPWLVMAAISEPHTSVACLRRALSINPASQRARQGMHWAVKKLRRQPGKTVQPAPKPIPAQARVIKKRASLWPRAFVALAFVFLLWAIWLGGNLSAQAFGGVFSGDQGPSWAMVEISKPTYTPTPSPTIPFTPTFTKTPTPTFTPTSTATEIPPPTLTEIPTSIPTPTPLPTDSGGQPAPVSNTYFVQEGETLPQVASRLGVDLSALAAANNLIDSAALVAGQQLIIPPGSANNPASPSGQKRIVVSISQQHLWAYEGDTMVFSFIASTGMGNSTRIGTFSVLDKIPNAYGANWNIWMPNWLGIYYSGYLENGIHALPILSNGQRLWAGYLGTPISFGCIVLGVDESLQLYDWAEVGTVVEIQY